MRHETKDLVRSLENLLTDCASFTFENVGDSHTGYLVSLNPKFQSWRQRVGRAIGDNFEPKSGPSTNLAVGAGWSFVGNGAKAFSIGMAHYSEALTSAVAAAADDIHAELRRRD